MLITTSRCQRLGLRPLARIPHRHGGRIGSAVHADRRPCPATEKVLQRAGLTLADIDLFEVNEAFAPVVLAWASGTCLGCMPKRVWREPTSTAGAIAIGHPLGASGARIMTTMVNALRAARRALRIANDV